jgi:hypothetical protein
MLFCVLLAVHKVTELSNEEEMESFLGETTLCTQFYRVGCKDSYFREFDLAADLFPRITFIRVNCSNMILLCKKYSINSDHEIELLKPRVTAFRGEEIAFDIIGFLEENTKLVSSVAITPSVLTPENFWTFVRSKEFSLVFFLVLANRQSQIVIPQIKQLIYAFQREDKVNFGYIDCTDVVNFCLSLSVEASPTIRAYMGDNKADFEGARSFAALLDFANEHFATFRRSDGWLNDRAGLITSAFPIIERFMRSSYKRREFNEIKAIAGTRYYQRVMKKMMKEGQSGLSHEIKKLSALKNASLNKPELYDMIIRNSNILEEFKRAGAFVPETDKEL